MKILIPFLLLSTLAFAQKKALSKTNWKYTLVNSGNVDNDSIQINILSETRMDFEITYKDGDTLLWSTAINNSGSIFLPRRDVDSLIIQSDSYPTIRFAFNDQPLEFLEVQIRQKNGLATFQEDESSTLTKDFLEDPIGCSLRDKHIVMSDKILFDNKSIIGLTREELILLIGEPNALDDNSKHISRRIKKSVDPFEYYITTCGENPGYTLIVAFVNNVVVNVTMRMYCS